MEFVGGTFIFNFRKLFDAGLINQNCVVEVEGKHYVFDSSRHLRPRWHNQAVHL